MDVVCFILHISYPGLFVDWFVWVEVAGVSISVNFWIAEGVCPYFVGPLASVTF